MSRRPPIADVLKRFPVTLGVALVTSAFFALEFVLGGATEPLVHVRLGALRADRVAEHGEMWRLFMPLWLHHGWVHFLLNGMALLQLGALTESIWGGRRLLVYYAVCGLAGSLASAAFNPMLSVGSVGASGALMGLAGLIVGTSWYGRDPVRGWLLQVTGHRLIYAVALTFALGAFLAMVLPIVDNWAHVGGFLCGMLLAAAAPDPDHEDLRHTTAAAAATAVALIGAMGWMAVDGARPDREVSLDIARGLAIQVTESPDSWTTPGLVGETMDWYDRAERSEEGLDLLSRSAGNLRTAARARDLVYVMYTDLEAGADRDHALLVAGERWLELAPDDPEALNAVAWHLVTRQAPTDRDPVRAEALSRESLARIAPDDGSSGRQRAVYLDTLAEILFFQGQLEEARRVQQESVMLARTLNEQRWRVMRYTFPQLSLPVDLFEARLEKIERAAAG